MDGDDDEACYINRVGDEILMIVFSKLTPYQLCDTVPYVCKRWQGLLKEQLVWKEARLVFQRNETDAYHERFVKVLNRTPRLAHLDINAVPYKYNCKNPLPVADILEAGANLHRNLKLSFFSFSYNLPDIVSILESNRNTLTSLCINDFYCQEADTDWNAMDAYRAAHETLIDSVLVCLRNLPALRQLSYDFGECWKYLDIPNYESRLASVRRVVDCIRSMPNLKEVTLMNLVWQPERPLLWDLKKKEPMHLERLSVFESYVSDEAFAAMVLQNKQSLKKVEIPDGVEERLSNALMQCPNLESVMLPTVKLALMLATSAPKLTSLHISWGNASQKVQANEIQQSSLFPRLQHLSLYDGDWDDDVRAALVQRCENLKTFQLWEFTNPILSYLRKGKKRFERLGSHDNPVVLLELINGSIPNLEKLDIGLPSQWWENTDRIQKDWVEPLKKLKAVRSNVIIV